MLINCEKKKTTITDLHFPVFISLSSTISLSSLSLLRFFSSLHVSPLSLSFIPSLFFLSHLYPLSLLVWNGTGTLSNNHNDHDHSDDDDDDGMMMMMTLGGAVCPMRYKTDNSC